MISLVIYENLRILPLNIPLSNAAYRKFEEGRKNNDTPIELEQYTKIGGFPCFY